MANHYEQMRRALDEQKKKNPELAYRFIDSKPEELRNRIEGDGWKIIKKEGAGVTGEIRVGDLVLAGRPRKEVEEEQAANAKRASMSLDAPVNQFNSDISRIGGRGRYLQPMSPDEAAKFGRRS
jgi:hypothetical protein